MTALDRAYDPIRFHRGTRGFAAFVTTLNALVVLGAVVAATGLAIFGADGPRSVRFFVWMIGSWVVATRFAVKPFSFTPQAHRVMARVPRPAPDARPLTGLRKRTAVRTAPTRRARPLPTPRIVQPVPSRIVLRPISTPTT